MGLPLGETIFGKTCLVVGFGNIASELVPRSVGAVKPGHHQNGSHRSLKTVGQGNALKMLVSHHCHASSSVRRWLAGCSRLVSG